MMPIREKEPSDLDKLFRALSSDTRRRILQLLAQGERYPYELSKTLGLTPPGVFKHLEALQEAGLVERQPGESDLGPDRVYYRLNARFGLSTTILPNAFVVRLISRSSGGIIIPQAFIIPEARHDVAAIRHLLTQLGKVNKRLADLDDERMRFASARGQIINQIESIMSKNSWDEESCQEVRALLDPIKQSATTVDDDQPDVWESTVKQALKLFERLFESHESLMSSDDDSESSDEEDEFILDLE
jgi:predicted transcriptional regulator